MKGGTGGLSERSEMWRPLAHAEQVRAGSKPKRLDMPKRVKIEGGKRHGWGETVGNKLML